MSERTKKLVLAALLGLLTLVSLGVGHRQVGYARDEGVYFEAGRRYGLYLQDAAASPSLLLDRRARDRVFRFNNEHPALMKMAAGVSGRLLAKPAALVEQRSDRGGLMPLLPEGAAMRLPAQLFAAAGVMLLFFAGATFGGSLAAGFLAAGVFILAPRVWFHAGLCAFDVPVSVATLAVALLYLKSLTSRRAAWALGPLFGVAISIKHNALFLGPLLAAHYLGCLLWARYRGGRVLSVRDFFPTSLWGMAVLGPLTAIALWPWLWAEPAARLADYFNFHLQHQWYNTEYLGQNENLPPLPMSFPFVMVLATVPITTLVLGVGGLAGLVRKDVTAPRDNSGALPTAPGVLFAGLALWPLLLIAHPSVPIFGGTKHFITAYPFFALGAAFAFGRLWPRAWASKRWLGAAALVAPSFVATSDAHPYGLSQYAAAVGGPRGAAQLGLIRGYWGHAAPALLPTIKEILPGTAPVYIHDIHEFARLQYEREGAWPRTLKSVPISRARAGLLFHELHMTTYEVELWDRMQTPAPVAGISLDDVPLTSLYGPSP